MVVEGQITVGHEYVIAGETFMRTDPDRAKPQTTETFQKGMGQNVTSSGSEEYPVGKIPAPHWVIFDAGSQQVHGFSAVQRGALPRRARRMLEVQCFPASACGARLDLRSGAGSILGVRVPRSSDLEVVIARITSQRNAAT